MVKLITLPDEIILEILGFVITLKNVCDYLVLNRDFEKFLKDKCKDFLYTYGVMKGMNLYRDIDTDDDSYGIREYVCLHATESTKIYKNISFIVVREKSMLDCPLNKIWITYYVENIDKNVGQIVRLYTTFVLHEQKLKLCRMNLGCKGKSGIINKFFLGIGKSSMLHIVYNYEDKCFTEVICKLYYINFNVDHGFSFDMIPSLMDPCDLSSTADDSSYDNYHMVNNEDCLVFYGKSLSSGLCPIESDYDVIPGPHERYYKHYKDMIDKHKKRAELICFQGKICFPDKICFQDKICKEYQLIKGTDILSAES